MLLKAGPIFESTSGENHRNWKKMVKHLTDDDLWKLKVGGHDPAKVFAAYDSAVNHKGQPTVILARTIKGYGMGEAGEGPAGVGGGCEGDHVVVSVCDLVGIFIYVAAANDSDVQ